MKALITGGAGFIGSHLVDGLLAEGHEVRVLDNLNPQVHGPSGKPPDYLSGDAELMIGDVRDPEAVARALEEVEAVFHQAAAVGVGQSMYEIARYVAVNSLGAAVLLEEVVKRRADIRKIVVASSMSIYGEGAYRDESGAIVAPRPRALRQMETHLWEVKDPIGRPLTPIPTPETKPLNPTSVYAITKYDHEQMFLVTGAAYNIPAVALRYFNTYGTRQALSNPYTGLLAIVCSQLMKSQSPAGLRGWIAATRLHPCLGYRSRQPAGAQERCGERSGLQCRLGPGGHGPEGHQAGVGASRRARGAGHCRPLSLG